MTKADIAGIVAAAKRAERLAVSDHLQQYFELTRFSEEAEGAEPNPEWDAGFQAALALVKGGSK